MLFIRLPAAQAILFLLLACISFLPSVPAFAFEIPIVDLSLGAGLHQDTDHRDKVGFQIDGKDLPDDGQSTSTTIVDKRRSRSSRLQVGIGQFDVLDRNRTLSFNLEYRSGRTAFFLSPAVGAIANIDGGLFGFGAIYSDIKLGPFHLVPELGFGAYRQGSSKDLGGLFSFREALQIAYQTVDGIAFGLQIAHISNASIYDNNPGQEDVHLTVSVPFDGLF